MKNRDPKKKQKVQETAIGKIIYGFLLFLPLLAIGVTCGYAIFNKNAYKSYSNFNENEDRYILVDDYTLIAGREYKFISSNLNSSEVKTNISGKLNLEDFSLIQSDRDLSSYDLSKINGFAIYRYNNNIQVHFYSATENITDINLSAYSLQFTFRFLSYNQVNTTNDFSYYFDSLIYELPIQYQNNTIDNVFYYSIDKVQQSPLFNWAENSIIYTTTASTCTALSITTPFIPLLMSYWLIISVIYFLYDIALMLVWIIHRKIHELQESI